MVSSSDACETMRHGSGDDEPRVRGQSGSVQKAFESWPRTAILFWAICRWRALSGHVSERSSSGAPVWSTNDFINASTGCFADDVMVLQKSSAVALLHEYFFRYARMPSRNASLPSQPSTMRRTDDAFP